MHKNFTDWDNHKKCLKARVEEELDLGSGFWVIFIILY